VNSVSDDLELELMRMRRMAELQKQIAAKKTAQEKPPEQKPAETPEDVLKRMFAGRAWEVWNAAEQQFPLVTQKLKEVIVQLVTQGKVTQPVTGEQLMGLYRKLGLNVRLNTKIRIYESGEMKTIADRVRG